MFFVEKVSIKQAGFVEKPACFMEKLLLLPLFVFQSLDC